MKTFKSLLDAYGILGYRCFAGNTSAFFANNPHVAAAYLEKDGSFPYEGGGGVLHRWKSSSLKNFASRSSPSRFS